MSRGALLAYHGLKAALEDSGWSSYSDAGLFMGVGASGGDLEQLESMLGKSLQNGSLSMQKFGDAGLRACNPLFAFQLMNNFSMCHGAILCGLQGPNGAFFSRGAGTAMALDEAIAILNDPVEPCSRALAGGSDSALHPVTASELRRHSFGASPSEGAALLALSTRREPASLASIRTLTFSEALPTTYELQELGAESCAFFAQEGLAGGEKVRSRLSPHTKLVHLEDAFGNALAATAALTWCAALDLVAQTNKPALACSLEVDGEPSFALLEPVE
jgi:hypothetical protein